MEAVIITSQAQFGDQFIHVGPSGWIWVNFCDTPPFILCWLMHCCIFLECTKSLWWSNAVTLPPSSPFLLAAWVNLQARPTFCFSRTKQFTTFCKEMSLLPVTTCLHRNRAIGKEAAAWVYIEVCANPHGYTQLHRNLASTEMNNRQKTADFLRHHQWFPCEMTSEKRLQKFHTVEVPIPSSG